MSDVLMWTTGAVIAAVSLLISAVTLLVISRLRDLGGDPGVADGREAWLSPDLSVTADLRALRD